MNRRNHLVRAHPCPRNPMGDLQCNGRALLGHQDILTATLRQGLRCHARLLPTKAPTVITPPVHPAVPKVKVYRLLMDRQRMEATLGRDDLRVPIERTVHPVNNHRRRQLGTVLIVSRGNRPEKVFHQPGQQVTAQNLGKMMILRREVHLETYSRINRPGLHNQIGEV